MKIKAQHLIISISILFFLFLSIYFFFIRNQNKKNWQFFIKDQIGAKSVLNYGKNLSFDQQSIYFIDGKGLLYSLNKQTGRINWLKKLKDHSPFEITQDDKHLYIASFDSHIYQINKNNGYISWSFAIPNQFWPDTEVVFDQNDNSVFFADRAGFLYALEKNSGKLAWKINLGNIDNSKVFVENSIHFGFLSQEEDLIVADNFPKKTVFYINKISGEILSTKKSEGKANIKELKKTFSFDKKLNLELENNIINQPKINLFDENKNLVWSYRTENRINLKEIYQNEQRLYYLNADNTILESIYIGNKNPNKEFFTKINFVLNENYAAHHPYKNSNPQINSEEIKSDLFLKISKKIDQINYTLKNFKKIFLFSFSHSVEQNYIEFDLKHEENFYENVFNDVKIDALFKNRETNQEIKVNGFYYDFNNWKIRALLTNGGWDWTIKIKTKYINKKINGSLIIDSGFKEKLKIDKGTFLEKDSIVFFPLGIQGVIMDQSKDGNNLNNMDYAKNMIPSKQSSDFNFINLTNYLNLYKQDANLNIFRYGPDNWAPSIWKDLTSKKSFSMDVKGNLQGDQILKELQEKDFKIIMSIFAFYPPYTFKESIAKKENREVLEKYLDYVIARYATSVDIWELTNEAAPPLEWLNFISDYIAKKDPYKHPITTNLEEPRLNNSNLLSIHLYLQKPNDNYHLINQVESLLNKQDQEKAILISEFGFQGSNYFEGSADWLRKFAWIASLKNIGVICWNTGYGFYESTFNGNVYLGPQERFYLKTLIDFLPEMKTPLKKIFEFANDGNLAIYNLSDNNYELYYLLNIRGNVNNYKLTVEKNEKKHVQIINPKTNMIVSEFELEREEKQINLPNFIDDLSIKINYIY